MSSPYRELPETTDPEPLPEFQPRPNLGRDVAVMMMLGVLLAVPSWHFEGINGIVKLLVLYVLPVVISVVIAVLYAPLLGWLDRRYARKVAAGIAELEARAAR
jgi:hypothetical protein